jgi:matrixin
MRTFRSVVMISVSAMLCIPAGAQVSTGGGAEAADGRDGWALGRAGGMLGDGWDGPGQNATTIFFHMERASQRLGPSQRQTLLDALTVWAEVVQIQFVEVPFANEAASIDFMFARGDHCNLEPAECGDSNCVFSGPEPSSLAHTGFPPGLQNPCGGLSAESFAGNVHFNDEQPLQTNPDNAGYSFMLVAAHNIGHALGLDNSANPGDHDVMGPIEWNDNFLGLGETDILQIQNGYAAGVGSVTTLETLGIWVNSSYVGVERGTPGFPFDTLAEGVAGLPPYASTITMHMLTGLYPESVTIDQPCIISADFGTVIIGR